MYLLKFPPQSYAPPTATNLSSGKKVKKKLKKRTLKIHNKKSVKNFVSIHTINKKPFVSHKINFTFLVTIILLTHFQSYFLNDAKIRNISEIYLATRSPNSNFSLLHVQSPLRSGAIT